MAILTSTERQQAVVQAGPVHDPRGDVAERRSGRKAERDGLVREDDAQARFARQSRMMKLHVRSPPLWGRVKKDNGCDPASTGSETTQGCRAKVQSDVFASAMRSILDGVSASRRRSHFLVIFSRRLFIGIVVVFVMLAIRSFDAFLGHFNDCALMFKRPGRKRAPNPARRRARKQYGLEGGAAFRALDRLLREIEKLGGAIQAEPFLTSGLICHGSFLTASRTGLGSRRVLRREG
ncbi:hypothetical protein M2322_004528 [Rhodoblastus acidophilus]|nr:hypothetical protein [Rhodoblastus acidophilus]MCW2318959.1 hypothetical protein [Rhodoblastus acidophilus]